MRIALLAVAALLGLASPSLAERRVDRSTFGRILTSARGSQFWTERSRATITRTRRLGETQLKIYAAIRGTGSTLGKPPGTESPVRARATFLAGPHGRLEQLRNWTRVTAEGTRPASPR